MKHRHIGNQIEPHMINFWSSTRVFENGFTPLNIEHNRIQCFYGQEMTNIKQETKFIVCWENKSFEICILKLIRTICTILILKLRWIYFILKSRKKHQTSYYYVIMAKVLIWAASIILWPKAPEKKNSVLVIQTTAFP